MLARNGLLITAAVLCHLLLAHRLVTSQLLPVAPPQNPLQTPSKTSVPVTIKALKQEKDGPVYKLEGQVEIEYGLYTLHADQVTYDSDSGQAQAQGHLLLDGGPNDEHFEASRGTYNLQSEAGRFEDVTGTIGVKLRNNRSVLTSSNPFFFRGKVVEKTGPDHYIVN